MRPSVKATIRHRTTIRGGIPKPTPRGTLMPDLYSFAFAKSFGRGIRLGPSTEVLGRSQT